MAEFVRFSVPKELAERQLQLVERVKKSGKLRVGSNEVTKYIERQKAKFVLMAEDVNPKELLMHIPILCEEKKVPYSYVSTKEELGKRAGLGVGTSAIAIVEEGDSKKELEEIVKKIGDLKG